MKMPSIFAGHGSPMNAIETSNWTKEWSAIGKRFKPKGILAISAHWYTEGSLTQDTKKPAKINDMYGFPKPLYDLKYPASGDSELTNKIVNALRDDVRIDNSWGIDHGTWSVLVHMYPKADISVVQLSIDGLKTPQQQFEVGQKIAALREEGYMILGSGNIVHGIYKAKLGVPTYDWAQGFDDYIENAIHSREYDKAINYKSLGEMATDSVPTPDHYYPLLNVLGTVGKEDKVEVFNKDFMTGALSMTGYIFTSD